MVVKVTFISESLILVNLRIFSIPFRHVGWEATMSYHNTNLESGEELEKSETRARTEEYLIMGLFRYAGIHVRLSARGVHNHLLQRGLFKHDKPLTNTRRALTNLTTKGYLQKNDQEFMVKEGGKRVHTWSLCNREQMRLL